MKIALTGNPNSGKTTMYNALTGQNEKVGNWTGVTVEQKEHALKRSFGKGRRITAVDLPGAYSLSPFTGEETITRDYILREAPDVIINLVDATALERSLFFTSELLELGIPTVVALNKSDLGEKKTEIDCALLSKALGCPVVETVSTSKRGLSTLIETAISVAGKEQSPPFHAEKPTDAAKEGGERENAARFAFVSRLAESAERRKIDGSEKTLSDRIDGILMNKWLGIPLFALVMLLVFQISQTYLGAFLAEGVTLPSGQELPGLVFLLEAFQAFVASLLEGADPLVTALLVDGMIGGVIAVVGFLPLVMVMYFLIALLEDCGYMARVAAILDPIFQRVGLSGRSVIPFVITVGCAVPGIMSSRTIRSERERRATAMLAPFMPCGAKIPVISLFAGAFFDNAGWVSALVYLLGILLIFVGALLVKLITAPRRKSSYFLIELPEYKRPSLLGALRMMCSRGIAYIVKASTVILLCNTAVQVMQSFTPRFTLAENASDSLLALIATPFSYLLFPIVGVLSWQLAAAAVTGFIAKENVVGTLAVSFVGLEHLIDPEELSLIEGTGGEAAGVLAISKAAALAYLMFNLYTPPCFAAIGAMRAEMKSGKWVLAGIGLQLGVGFTVGYLIYTVGTRILSPASLSVGGALFGLALVLSFVTVLVSLIVRARRREAR